MMTQGQRNFPITALGGSAGSLEVFKSILSQMPTDTGIAFVILLHLDPKHESMTAKILSKSTKMPVIEIQEGVKAQPNSVYVIPPNHHLDMSHGIFHLLPRVITRGQHLPVDFFLNALAHDQKEKAIGIIVSGTASDGSRGLLAIKAEGGITLVQNPESAQYDGMPRSAIASGAADLILTPEEIVQELTRISQHPAFFSINTAKSKEVSGELKYTQPEEESLSKIFALLQNGANADFTNYKLNTIQRRINRRMLLKKTPDFRTYAHFLENNPQEIGALFADILIHVTEFFRDKNVFETLKSSFLPRYMRNRDKNLPFRVWIPGCSTGEEAYSIAMIFMEYLEDTETFTPLSIFATDLSEEALHKARTAIYPEAISQILSKERFKQFFERVDEGRYRITKTLRDTCLFSRHDITRDPPFAKVDLISCRNLLIYFDTELQKRVIPLFHYSLNPGGLLMLGKSETISGFSSLFSLLDKVEKIYVKKNVIAPLKIQFPLTRYAVERMEVGPKYPLILPKRIDIQRESDRVGLSKFVPPCAVINDMLEVVQTRGQIAPFLQIASGYSSYALVRMAHPEIVNDLKTAIQEARKKEAEILKKDLTLHYEGKTRTLQIYVIPLPVAPQSKEHYYSLFFEETHESAQAKALPITKKRKISSPITLKSQARILALRLMAQEKQHLETQKKLAANLEYQQSLIEQYEIAQEELVSSYEELQSTNEELQSTNEELETAKEELQSANEELTTVNEEMQNRNLEISQLYNDLNNLLTSVNIPIIMISPEGKIRRFTPKAGKLLNLIPTDVGRPVSDIKPNIEVENLDALVTEVTKTIRTKELDVQDKQGHWYHLEIKPYRTNNNKIDGSVIALIDIDTFKRNTEELKKAILEIEKIHKKARADAETIIQAQPLPLLILDSNHRIKLANIAFCEKFKISQAKTVGKLITELGNGYWNIPELIGKLERVLSELTSFSEFEIECNFPKIGYKSMSLNAVRVRLTGSDDFAILLAFEDRTNQKEIEKVRGDLLERERNSRTKAEQANKMKDEFLATLSHELRTPLTTILSWSQLLRSGRLDPDKYKRGIEILEDSAKAQSQLIDDLLDVSRIQEGKLKLNLKNTDPRKLASDAIDSVRSTAVSKSIQIKTEYDPSLSKLTCDPTRLQQILWNLLTNAIKFSHKGGTINLKLNNTIRAAVPHLEIEVKDNGIGIKPEFLPIIFDRFSQADSTTTRIYGGLGLGLAIVRMLVEMHDGTVQASSLGKGKGATFTVYLPIKCDEKINQELTESESESAIHSTSLQKISILLVEDDQGSREAITMTLNSFGAKVEACQSVPEALLTLNAFEPDIIVSDIGMPGEDGYSLIHKVRAAHSKLAQLPAIALTAYATQDSVQIALKSGFQIHLAKPVEAAKLARTIQSLCKKDSMCPSRDHI